MNTTPPLPQTAQVALTHPAFRALAIEALGWPPDLPCRALNVGFDPRTNIVTITLGPAPEVPQ